jgi:AcrR family transcriptional regulator
MSDSAVERIDPLRREAVVDAGVRLVRAGGLGGLTMRAVAAELGVTPMALYYHVANKEELIGLILQRVMLESAPLQIGDAGWEASLREHLLSRWRVLRGFPGLAAFMVDRPMVGATADSRREGTHFFIDVGFAPDSAELAWSFAMTYIHGRLSIEAHIDIEAAREVGLDFRTSREHVEFGVEAVILALRTMLRDPELATGSRTPGS